MEIFPRTKVVTCSFITLTAGLLVGALTLETIKYSTGEAPIIVATLPDGGGYSGDMKNGLFDGKGTLKWGNGETYKGQFSQGLFHGEGEYQYANGDLYTGQFESGAIQGYGRFEYKNGGRYEGDLVHGLFEGTGTFKYINGDTYTGEFSQGKMHGQGIFTTKDDEIYVGTFVRGEFTGIGTHQRGETIYQGEFKDWQYNGEGEWKDNRENRYTGTFVSGQLTGKGEFFGTDGTHYQGEFEYWAYSGEGILTTSEGDKYEGEFNYGQYHGYGVLHFAKPLDGIEKLSGTWRQGELIKPDDPDLYTTTEQATELALYNQQRLLHNIESQLLPSTPSKPDMYFLGIAGDGMQGVFRRELNYIKHYFDTQYGTAGRSLALINSRETIAETPLATQTSIAQALQAISEKMDTENDILFIYLTSHGSKDFNFALNQPGMPLADLSATKLAELISATPIHWKVIVISACYSGGFIPALKDDSTLIITASSSKSRSFGCSDRAEFTYFGEAFFKDALPISENFSEAFEKASTLIAAREKAKEVKHSKPQISKPKAILKQLKFWREKLTNKPENFLISHSSN